MADDLFTSELPASETVPKLDAQDVARLRIHHLFLWISLTAVLLGLSRAAVTTFQHTHPDVRIGIDPVGWAISYVVLGGEATILCCLIKWWRRGLLGGIQPGEWLAINGALSGGLTLAQSMIVILGSPPGDIDGVGLLGTIQTFTNITYISWFFVLAWFAATSREIRTWRFAYWLLAAEALPFLVTTLLRWTIERQNLVFDLYLRGVALLAYLPWVLLPIVCYAAYLDWIRHRIRRWTHWLGFALYVFATGYGLVAWFWPP